MAGFDPQLTGEYSADMVDDLDAFLAPDKGAALVNYGYLEEVIGYMGDYFELPPDAKPADFEKEMGKVSRLLEKIAAGGPGQRSPVLAAERAQPAGAAPRLRWQKPAESQR